MLRVGKNNLVRARRSESPVFDCAAVVFITRLVYPAPVIEAGLKLQVLSLGRPVQEKFMVPL